MILLAQFDDEVSSGRLFGLGSRAALWREEEGGSLSAPEMVAHHLEGARGVAKQTGGLSGRAPVDEESPEGFVLALFGRGGFEEEATACGYVMWCAYAHTCTVTQATRVVKKNWQCHVGRNCV